MTKLTEEQIQKNNIYAVKLVHIVVTIISYIVIIAIAYGTLKADLYNHIDNPDVHMTYKAKVEAFVPRGEYKDLKKSLDDFKNDYKEDIKELKEMLRELQ